MSERPTAREIAAALGQPPPTDEQRAVVEAPLDPLLVVAGAGSGKTETMAARVVWLVAGGEVRPDEVLGLTFTRKAAGELAERVRRRLRRLRSTGLWTPQTERPGARSSADDVGPGEAGEVTVSTYHAYAGRIVREHGLRLGVEPESRLLSEAAAWQVASEVVERWTGEMGAVDSAVSTVVRAVLALAGECAEHLVAPEQVEQWLAGRVEVVQALPYSPTRAQGQYAKVRDLVGSLQARRQLLPIVQAYVRAKRERDSLDFGDQVALAAELARTVEPLQRTERGRYRAVLLDEYQDTSHAQLEMLHALFGRGHGVTAVGDPNQSIYGWRGASAGTLARFADRFTDAGGGRAQVLNLSTSWRNDQAVLDAANLVSAPLRAAVAIPVRRLDARPGAAAGRVEVRSYDTLEDEADAVAAWVADAWWGPAGPGTGRRGEVTAAVLCRKRSQFAPVEAALLARGLPVEVVGLGGLLSTPEVADIVAALHVVHDPSRGDLLMRLLTGPVTRLGPRDLVALGAWSRELQRRRSRPAGRGGPPDADRAGDRDGHSAAPDARDVDGDGLGSSVEVVGDVVEEASLVEALDELPPPGWVEREGRSLSAKARVRLQRLAGTLRELRGRTALALPELVADVERALLLDVEVAARPGVRPGAARAHLDAFADVADGFSAAADRPTLGAFLAWLDAAQDRERGLEPGVGEVDVDAVQVLTVHAAKGLEWDVVAVPGLVEGTFPAHRQTARRVDGQWVTPDVKDAGWLAELGALPHALRGDADNLPDLPWAMVGDQVDLLDHRARLELAGGEHELAEERRLAYVAFTRARRALLLVGHVWADGSTPRLPSRFVDELVEHGGASLAVGPLAELPADERVVNPRTAEPFSRPWPADPLGARRPALQAGADLVHAALARPPSRPGPPGRAHDAARAGRWAWEADVLLAERDRARERTIAVSLPSHLSASRLVQLAAEPEALALEVRRPMPREPHPATRRGTAFHAWVEQLLGAAAIVDVVDLPGAADDEPAPDDDLAGLQQRFLASEWADRPVVAVEVAIETPVDGTVVRGRVDAVFARSDGGVDVVDWKTGLPPAGRAAAARSVQLAAYRLAWARLHDLPLERVGAAFFYAATGQTVRPVDLLDEAGLVDLLRGVDSVG